MRLRRVRLINYRGVAERNVEFAPGGVTIIEGQNEVGKTSIAEALQLAIDFRDSSGHRRVKSVKPVDRDGGPEVEIELSTGGYELVYRKRWLSRPETTLRVESPCGSENLTGREAHERVQGILAETLDKNLWKALQIEQGTELTLPAFDLPSMGTALDRAAGGDVAADREDTLWERVVDEYGKYWTPTGLPRQELRALESGVEEARNAACEVSKSLDDIEADVTRLSRLEEASEQLEMTRAECEKHEAELTDQWESAQKLRSEVELLAAVRDGAEAKLSRASNDQHRRQGLIDGLGNLTGALTELESEAERADPALVDAARRSEAAEAARNAARGALRGAESELQLAAQDRDYRRQEIEAAQLGERYERYEEAARALTDAESVIESSRVDDALLERIEEAYLEHERARAAADSAAASVDTTALTGVSLHVDGEAITLAAGDEHSTLVDGEAVLVIPDVASIRVRAGIGSREQADRRNSAQEALRRLCGEGGVADLAEARAEAQKRRDALHNQKEATEAMKQSLRDLTAERLRSMVANLTRRVAAYPQARPDDPPMPADLDEAQEAARALERCVETLRAEYDTLEAAARTDADALQQAQVNNKVLAARIADARVSRDAAAANLAAAREHRADEDLTAALVVCRKETDDALNGLEDAKAALEAADPDSLLERRLENARESKERAVRELQGNRGRQNELRSSLAHRGEDGLHTRRDEALARQEYAEREYRRAQDRADAAKLLKETFEKHRQLARQRYVQPFKERIDRLGRIVFGQTFAVELDDNLRAARRTLDGVTLDVEQLSTGAREQIGVLSRLACAAIVSPEDGGAPVMIDDALGWSDPQRLQRTCDAIAAAARHCQIIVLTCTPGRYSAIGNARVIDLDA